MSGEERGSESLGKSVTTKPRGLETFKHTEGSKKNAMREGKFPHLAVIQNVSRGWAPLGTGSLGESDIDMIDGIQGPSQLDPRLLLIFS